MGVGAPVLNSGQPGRLFRRRSASAGTARTNDDASWHHPADGIRRIGGGAPVVGKLRSQLPGLKPTGGHAQSHTVKHTKGELQALVHMPSVAQWRLLLHLRSAAEFVSTSLAQDWTLRGT
eukprot:SAG31_NODE_17857_length_655_cov_1.399281_2_plen_120_part_00